MKESIYIVFIVLYSFRLWAQDSSGAREEGWPELNVFYNIDDHWRLFGMYSATKIRTSDYTDGATGIYVDYFSKKSLRQRLDPNFPDSARGSYLWFRLGYYYSTTPNKSANPVKEHSVATEINSRFWLPKNTLLTLRHRFDFRTVNHDFKVRYRPRITIEKDMRTRYLYFTPYIFGEYFLNFNESPSNRFRYCVGLEIKVALYINLETYYLHQFENGDTVDPVNAIGLALKFYLSKQAINHVFNSKNEEP